MVLHDALHLLHGHARPVGHFQVGPGIGVEQGGLAAVRVADKSNGHFLFTHARHLLPL